MGDYSGFFRWAQFITSVPRRGRQEVREEKDTVQLALKMEKVATSQARQAASRGGKRP